GWYGGEGAGGGGGGGGAGAGGGRAEAGLGRRGRGSRGRELGRSQLEGLLELWRGVAHPIRDARGVHRRAHHARGDEEEELRLLDLLVGGPLERAHHRDPLP